ncbi:SRPBCC family protein [Streptomyces subrutilus]|uniref:SRPBCC family protein n=1 Tax=Streptomyces subrutilus TaxID=36818 RepID=UPI003410F9BB
MARIKDSPAADRARQELERYLMAQAERALAGAGRAMGRSTARLTAVADGTSPGLRALALGTARKVAKGRGPLRAVAEAGAQQARSKAANAVRERLSRRGGRPGGGRPTLILESVDVGVPVKDAYNQWTRYRDFPEFAHGVTSAEATDETTSDWNARIFWSRRSWTAHVTEQVPDERIAWTSEGSKGTTRGVVTFHELTVDLTRVLLVIEYYPRGLLEKTANLWRAQGRRVRSDLRNYARFLTLKGGQAEGWRGEIRDGELVGAEAEADEAGPADGTQDAELEEAYQDEDDDQVYADDDEGYEDDDEGAAEDPDVDYEDEADDPGYEYAEPAGEAGPEDEPEAARPRGRRGNRRSA